MLAGAHSDLSSVMSMSCLDTFILIYSLISCTLVMVSNTKSMLDTPGSKESSTWLLFHSNPNLFYVSQSLILLLSFLKVTCLVTNTL
ncbi:hypothetical protein L596_017874 [Steinernema carpocapsae]|uniref:Uncharacterized protein n=1 Tax=Steinernema carpocapsae TaxID=34508 RepID=A0A4U5N2Y5_STECR|nr:hypothetical protein L596_017874 [Steinernema carpocapsae]